MKVRIKAAKRAMALMLAAVLLVTSLPENELNSYAEEFTSGTDETTAIESVSADETLSVSENEPKEAIKADDGTDTDETEAEAEVTEETSDYEWIDTANDVSGSSFYDAVLVFDEHVRFVSANETVAAEPVYNSDGSITIKVAYDGYYRDAEADVTTGELKDSLVVRVEVDPGYKLSTRDETYEYAGIDHPRDYITGEWNYEKISTYSFEEGGENICDITLTPNYYKTLEYWVNGVSTIYTFNEITYTFKGTQDYDCGAWARLETYENTLQYAKTVGTSGYPIKKISRDVDAVCTLDTQNIQTRTLVVELYEGYEFVEDGYPVVEINGTTYSGYGVKALIDNGILSIEYINSRKALITVNYLHNVDLGKGNADILAFKYLFPNIRQLSSVKVNDGTKKSSADTTLYVVSGNELISEAAEASGYPGVYFIDNESSYAVKVPAVDADAGYITDVTLEGDFYRTEECADSSRTGRIINGVKSGTYTKADADTQKPVEIREINGESYYIVSDSLKNDVTGNDVDINLAGYIVNFADKENEAAKQRVVIEFDSTAVDADSFKISADGVDIRGKFDVSGTDCLVGTVFKGTKVTVTAGAKDNCTIVSYTVGKTVTKVTSKVKSASITAKDAYNYITVASRKNYMSVVAYNGNAITASGGVYAIPAGVSSSDVIMVAGYYGAEITPITRTVINSGAKASDLAMTVTAGGYFTFSYNTPSSFAGKTVKLTLYTETDGKEVKLGTYSFKIKKALTKVTVSGAKKNTITQNAACVKAYQLNFTNGDVTDLDVSTNCPTDVYTVTGGKLQIDSGLTEEKYTFDFMSVTSGKKVGTLTLKISTANLAKIKLTLTEGSSTDTEISLKPGVSNAPSLDKDRYVLMYNVVLTAKDTGSKFDDSSEDYVLTLYYTDEYAQVRTFNLIEYVDRTEEGYLRIGYEIYSTALDCYGNAAIPIKVINKAAGSGCKEEFSAELEAAIYDTVKGNYYKFTNPAVLESVSTKAPAYSSKITARVTNSTVYYTNSSYYCAYGGYDMWQEIATLSYDKGTTYYGYTAVDMTGSDMNQLYFDISDPFKLKVAALGYTCVEGKHKIAIYPITADGGYAKPTYVTVTVKPGPMQLNLGSIYSVDTELYKQAGKEATLKVPAIFNMGMYSVDSKASGITYSIGKGYTDNGLGITAIPFDSDDPLYGMVTFKNNKLTVNKNYVLSSNEAENMIYIIAQSKFDPTVYTYYTVTLTNEVETLGGAGICVAVMGNANYGIAMQVKKDSVIYSNAVVNSDQLNGRTFTVLRDGESFSGSGKLIVGTNTFNASDFTYKSSNTKVATIGSDGVIKIVKVPDTDTKLTFTATEKTGSKRKVSITVTLTKPRVSLDKVGIKIEGSLDGYSDMETVKAYGTDNVSVSLINNSEPITVSLYTQDCPNGLEGKTNLSVKIKSGAKDYFSAYKKASGKYDVDDSLYKTENVMYLQLTGKQAVLEITDNTTKQKRTITITNENYSSAAISSKAAGSTNIYVMDYSQDVKFYVGTGYAGKYIALVPDTEFVSKSFSNFYFGTEIFTTRIIEVEADGYAYLEKDGENLETMFELYKAMLNLTAPKSITFQYAVVEMESGGSSRDCKALTKTKKLTVNFKSLSEKAKADFTPVTSYTIDFDFNSSSDGNQLIYEYLSEPVELKAKSAYTSEVEILGLKNLETNGTYNHITDYISFDTKTNTFSWTDKENDPSQVPEEDLTGYLVYRVRPLNGYVSEVAVKVTFKLNRTWVTD